MKPMITNGGSHPADAWADHAVETLLDLVQIDPASTSDDAKAARLTKRELSPKLFAVINAKLEAVQQAEKTLPKTVTTTDTAYAHCYALNIANPDLDNFTNVVLEQLKGTPFEAHFNQPDPKAAVRSILGQCMADVMHIERRYHHDRLLKLGA